MKSQNNQAIKPPLVVLGLGNPGARYEDSRHNAGYFVVDALLKEPPEQLRRRLFSSYASALLSHGDSQDRIVLVRSCGYMNRSGEIVPSILRRFHAGIENLLVVVDNMDLPPGQCRLKKGGSDAGHNGLKSLAAVLGSGDFMRLYIGVGRPQAAQSVVEHVLGRPDEQDRMLIDSAVLRASEAVKSLASSPFERVAEELNRRES